MHHLTTIYTLFPKTEDVKIKDLFPSERIRDLDLQGIDTGHAPVCEGSRGNRKRRGTEYQRYLISRILAYAMDYIYTQCIVNKRFYCLPLKRQYGVIYVGRKGYTDRQHCIAKRGKAYQNIDLLTTRGHIYELHLYLPNQPRWRKVVCIRVGRYHWSLLVEQMNQGVIYETSSTQMHTMRLSQKEVNTYLHNHFPQLEKRLIYRIQRWAWYQIVKNLRNNRSVSLTYKMISSRFFYRKKITRKRYQSAQTSTTKPPVLYQYA